MSGAGPAKELWIEEFENLPCEKIKVYFNWFEFEDYVKICGAVDFGVSLHNSISKVDLPMKILDTFGC